MKRGVGKVDLPATWKRKGDGDRSRTDGGKGRRAAGEEEGGQGEEVATDSPNSMDDDGARDGGSRMVTQERTEGAKGGWTGRARENGSAHVQ